VKLILLSIAFSFATVAASPVISRVTPLAVVPGKKTKLTLSGSNLDSVTHLSTFFGPTARCLTNSTDAATFEVFCPAGRTGVESIQAHGPEGLSNFHLILIDSLPTQTNTAGHQLVPPIALDATCESEKITYYTFPAKAGEELSIEVLAHRIGSQADPVLRVLDAEGRELAFCDDEDGVWRDARLRFRAPKTAEFKLAVHDVGYGGGSQYFYRLRLGDFPIISTEYPLRDWKETGTRELTYVFTNWSPANPEPSVWFSEFPMLMEREPNDREAVQEFGLPVIVNGRFQSASDHDSFRFIVSENQRLAFDAQTRSLGSPCDLLLRLRKPGGELILENSGRNDEEPSFSHAFAEAGTYILEARELTGAAPADSAYRVKVTNWKPTFTLSADVNKLEVSPAGSAQLKITCERDGYEGKIELTSHLILENNVVAANAKEVEITVRLKEPVQHPIDFTIEGKGTNGVVRTVSTRPALRKTFPLMLNPPPGLDGRFVIVMKQK
jgi:hypothetical protein